MSSSRVVISILALFFGFQLSTASHVSARTWFVERDGSGDFIVIQDAVDAAASGDTVRIGLGRFDEKHLVTCPGWSDYVRVLVTQHELTIIGSGPGTIIGQVNPWEPEEGYHKGIATGSLWGNQILRIESLHFEHMRDGIYTGYEDTAWNIFEVSDCSFNGNEIDLWLLGIGGTAAVNNCDFQNYTSEGKFIIGWDHLEMDVVNCNFRRLHHIYTTGGISLNRVQDTLIENCNFFEGTVGISLSSSGPALIKNCLFDDQGNAAIAATLNSALSIDGCQFRNQAIALWSYSTSVRMEMINSIVEDVDDCSILINSTEGFTVHDCDLAKGDRGVVYIPDRTNCLSTFHLDMTNNYWGTDDPDSIQAWIRDRNDTDLACFWVDYEPFYSTHTPVQTKSLGGLKALFR